jgi:hypothetical protein
VAILEISKTRFDELRVPDSCRSLWSEAEEVAWFRDDYGLIVGVIAHVRLEGRWSYCVLLKEDGLYRRVVAGAGFRSLESAKREITGIMQRYDAIA